MSYCFFLLIDSSMCLVIFSVMHIHIKVNPASFFPLFDKVIWIFSTLFNEISGKVFVIFFSGYFIETQKSQLDFLMSRNARFFTFFCSKTFPDMFCHALHHMKQTVFSSHLIVSRRCFHHMSGTV